MQISAALITAAVAGSAYYVVDGSGCDSETHSAAPLRSALTVSDSLGGARRVLALFIVVMYWVSGIIITYPAVCQSAASQGRFPSGAGLDVAVSKHGVPIRLTDER